MTRPPDGGNAVLVEAPSLTPAGNAPALLTLALCLTLILVSKGAIETHAVFLLPLAGEFGWSRGSVTSVFSVTLVIIGLSAPLIGIAFDRLGPRRLYLFGLITLAAGFAIAAVMSSLWHLYAGIGVIAGIGAAALGGVPHIALLSRWFNERLSLATSAVFAAGGFGMLIIVPLTQYVIETYGWRAAYLSLSGGLLVVAGAIAAAPWKRLAAGRSGKAAGATTSVSGVSGVAAGTVLDWSVRRALGTSEFWSLFVVYFFAASAHISVSVQIVAFLVDAGFAPLRAAGTVGVTAVASTVGMLLFGAIADRLGRRTANTVSFICSAVGIGALIFMLEASSVGLLAVFFVSFGIANGARQPIVSSAAAAIFRGPRLGGIYGLLTLAIGLGGALGSSLAGFLHDWSGGYAVGLWLSMACALGGIAPFWLQPALRRL